MAHILVADDDAHILDVVEYALTQDGHKVKRTDNGKDTLAAFNENGFEIVVLDVNMPPPDGFDVLREIRKNSAVPVIFLTSRDEEVDRIVGLEIGADDYVTKPFSPRELAARVKAILRRTTGPSEDSDEQVLEYGPLRLDEDRYYLFVGEEPIGLGKVEFNLLKVMLKRPGRVYSRKDLLDLAWGEDYIATDRVVDTHVKRIRQKIREVDEEAAGIVETVHGVGYRIRELE